MVVKSLCSREHSEGQMITNCVNVCVCVFFPLRDEMLNGIATYYIDIDIDRLVLQAAKRKKDKKPAKL